MTNIASLQELKDIRREYIELLYNAKDEKQISYLIKELKMVQEAITTRLDER